MKNNRIIKIIGLIILFAFLIVGIPVIINECYKANRGYLTVWSGADVLGYYGSILGSAIAAITLVVTIVFTKKQIQRESYLKSEDEKWSKLESVFLKILDSINPISALKNVMDNGFTDPSKAINILQKYQMNCITACDQLNAHLNVSDYPKFKKLIDDIAEISGELIKISEEEFQQYSDLRFWNHKDNAIQMLEIEKEHPGSFPQDNIEFSKSILKITSSIQYTNIEEQIAKLNSDFVNVYETKFKALLQLTGATFEKINDEIQQNADSILRLRRK